MVDDECRQPGYHSLIDHNKQGISSTTHLPLHSGDSGHAGGVQQGEHEEGQSCCSGQHGGKGGRQVGHRRACQHGQCADHRFFGSETGDLQGLQLAARALCSREFQEGMRGALQAGVQREKLLARLCPGVSPAVFLGKNDILGAEYCRFLQKVIPMPIKRMDCTGATALRAAMAEEILRTGENPKGAVLSHRLADLLFYFLRCADTPPEGFAEGAGGVIRRLYKAAREAENGEDMFLRAATKQYTNARLRRSALFALTKTTLDMLRAQPTYTRVLAANAQGRACLAGLRKDEGQIQLITNHRGRNELSAQGRRQYLHGERADAIYTLCMEPPRPAGWFAAVNPKMV